MVKIKLMNYDASEYKMMEDDLNTLANKGYTCNSVDLITFLKKDTKKTHYVTDIFCAKESTQFAKRREKDEWISNYIEYGYHYIGKVRNIYIFKGGSNNPKRKETPTELLLSYFKGLRTILKMILLILALAITFYFVPSVFSNVNMYEFITNGSIIIHYTPAIICFSLLFRAIFNYYNNEQIKRRLKNKEKPILTNQNKYRKFRLTYLYLLIGSSLLLVLGITLDSFERNIVPIDTNKILTLQSFGLPSNTKEYPTYTTSSSILIPHFYSYVEQSGDLSIKDNAYGNVLSLKYYEFKNNNDASIYIDTFMTSHNEASKITPSSNNDSAYVTYSSDNKIIDTVLLKQDNTVLFIATSFDLSLPKHQKVIQEFHQK